MNVLNKEMFSQHKAICICSQNEHKVSQIVTNYLTFVKCCAIIVYRGFALQLELYYFVSWQITSDLTNFYSSTTTSSIFVGGIGKLRHRLRIFCLKNGIRERLIELTLLSFSRRKLQTEKILITKKKTWKLRFRNW